MNRYFSEGGEFSQIEKLFDASHFSREGRGLGDDAFLLPSGDSLWAITTDSSVEGIHYNLAWTTPAGALRKSLLSNLSDINAMGAEPELAFFNLGALSDWSDETWTQIAGTLREMEERYGFKVVGGDTVRKPAEGFFSFTLMGRVASRPLLRSNARPGQSLYVSGRLGSSAAGLKILQAGGRGQSPEETRWIEAHLLPDPPLKLGPALSRHPTEVAAIDVSDGLSSELWHLSRQSGVRMTIEGSALPVDGLLKERFAEAEWRDFVLNGGEDYQLVFSGDFSDSQLVEWSTFCDITRIGKVEDGSGVFWDHDDKIEAVPAGGWVH